MRVTRKHGCAVRRHDRLIKPASLSTLVLLGLVFLDPLKYKNNNYVLLLAVYQSLKNFNFKIKIKILSKLKK